MKTVGMKKKNAVRALEEELKSAQPADVAKLTKKLIKLKDKWVNQ